MTKIVRFAEPRDHLVTRKELREELGLSDHQIDHLVQSAALTVVERRLYSTVAVESSVRRLALGACLLDGNVVVSHHTAAEHYGLRRGHKDQLHLAVPSGHRFAFLEVVGRVATDALDVSVFEECTRRDTRLAFGMATGAGRT